MMKTNVLVKIVIPIYTTSLTENDHKSLRRCYELYEDSHEIIFIDPRSLDMAPLSSLYPKGRLVSFANEYFKGIAGYNRLMLSKDLYEKFLDTKYILIYQTDAYLFSDKLDEWCQKDYDYIGAPWYPKKKYRAMHYRAFMKVRSFYRSLTGKFDPADIFYQVGNGGLSLRNTKKHYHIASQNSPVIVKFRKNCDSTNYNEDIFWSIKVNQTREEFNYPP